MTKVNYVRNVCTADYGFFNCRTNREKAKKKNVEKWFQGSTADARNRTDHLLQACLSECVSIHTHLIRNCKYCVSQGNIFHFPLQLLMHLLLNFVDFHIFLFLLQYCVSISIQVSRLVYVFACVRACVCVLMSHPGKRINKFSFNVSMLFMIWI